MDIAKKREAEAVFEIEEEPFPSPEKEENIAPEKNDDSVSYKELIETISEIGGVEGALLRNNDGLVAESKWIDNQKPDLFGALARDIEQTIQTQMDTSVFGKYENVLIEGENLIINMIP